MGRSFRVYGRDSISHSAGVGFPGYRLWGLCSISGLSVRRNILCRYSDVRYFIGGKRAYRNAARLYPTRDALPDNGWDSVSDNGQCDALGRFRVCQRTGRRCRHGRARKCPGRNDYTACVQSYVAIADYQCSSDYGRHQCRDSATDVGAIYGQGSGDRNRIAYRHRKCCHRCSESGNHRDRHVFDGL